MAAAAKGSSMGGATAEAAEEDGAGAGCPLSIYSSKLP